MSNSQPHSPHRIRFNFWLNMQKEDEEEIADKIELLKNERLFTATIRQGIQLIMSLREGNLDVLFQLFPWIQPEMISQLRKQGLIPADIEHQQLSDSIPDREKSKSDEIRRASDALQEEQKRLENLRAEQQKYERNLETWAKEREKQIKAQWEHIEREKERLASERAKNQSTIEKKLEKLEKLLIQQGNQPIDRPSYDRGGGPKSLSGLSGGPQSMGQTSLPPPQFDDEDDGDLLEVKEAEGHSNSSMNFIKSVQRLMDL